MWLARPMWAATIDSAGAAGYYAAMELREFKVGESFWAHEDEWRCTDVGTRVIVAIKLGPTEVVTVDANGETFTHLEDDPHWFDGPPYAVPEVVFDEDDQLVCFPTRDAMLADAEGES